MKRSGLLILTLTAAGCAMVSPRTSIESTWRDPTYSDGGFSRIAVLGTFRTESESRNFEDAVVAELEQQGLTAIAGRTFLQDGSRYSEDELARRVRGVDADGAMVFRLISVDEDLTYEQPFPYLNDLPPRYIVGDPYYWYYRPHWSLYPYWRSSLDVARAPGYWQRNRYLIVETSLFDNETDQLVWTAKTETLESNDFARLGTSIAHAVSEQLADRGLIEPEAMSAAR